MACEVRRYDDVKNGPSLKLVACEVRRYDDVKMDHIHSQIYLTKYLCKMLCFITKKLHHVIIFSNCKEINNCILLFSLL